MRTTYVAQASHLQTNPLKLKRDRHPRKHPKPRSHNSTNPKRERLTSRKLRSPNITLKANAIAIPKQTLKLKRDRTFKPTTQTKTRSHSKSNPSKLSTQNITRSHSNFSVIARRNDEAIAIFSLPTS
jgi:hypothetical protein